MAEPILFTVPRDIRLMSPALGRALRGEPLSNYLDHLVTVAEEDVRALKEAEKSYGDSWKQRGGVGAFMMLARKWDRIEKQVGQDRALPPDGGGNTRVAHAYDVFAHIKTDNRPEGLLDDIRDLRRYLMLVEAEMVAQGVVRERYRQRRATAILFLGGKCVECGSEEDLHIDHIDPNTKEPYIGQLLTTRSWSKVIEPELKKYQLLCRSCHENKTAFDNQ